MSGTKDVLDDTASGDVVTVEAEIDESLDVELDAVAMVEVVKGSVAVAVVSSFKEAKPEDEEDEDEEGSPSKLVLDPVAELSSDDVDEEEEEEEEEGGAPSTDVVVVVALASAFTNFAPQTQSMPTADPTSLLR